MTAIAEKLATQKPATPWPIARSHNVSLTPAQERNTLAVATAIRAINPEIDFTDKAASLVSIGWCPGPTLYLEDHRGVDLVPEKSAKAFEYRMLGLAGEGDAYLLSCPSDKAFEEKLGKNIGFGSPRIINLEMEGENNSELLAATCLKDKEAVATLAEMAAEAGVLNIVPYQVTADVWALGAGIAELSGCPVKIVGPNPKLSELANDKLWFTDLAVRLLGAKSVPKTFTAYNGETAAKHLFRLAKSHKMLVVKIPTSAGGLGNIPILSKDLQNLSLKEIFLLICEKLRTKGWSIGRPLLVGVWDDYVVSSPSVQLWVPETEEGLPIIEGVFAQAIRGNAGAFVGAERLVLTQDLRRIITHEAMQIARVFQHLGYFGRLSLDTVLIDPPGSPAKFHWIEANARWGGVSIPMTIGNKITGGRKPAPVLILQHMRKKNEDVSLSQKLIKGGISEISSSDNRARGFVQLLPSSGPVQLIAAYGFESDEAAIIKNM